MKWLRGEAVANPEIPHFVSEQAPQSGSYGERLPRSPAKAESLAMTV